MIVYKFGGASVKSAQGVKKLGEIISMTVHDLVVVVSAMDKMTNALEKLVFAYCNKKSSVKQHFESVKKFHVDLVDDLFVEKDARITKSKLMDYFIDLNKMLDEDCSGDYDFVYDKIVSYGELFSTRIVSDYLKSIDIDNEWVDIRTVLKTDQHYRNANVDYASSEKRCKENFRFSSGQTRRKIYLTQGFIASDMSNNTTTLGREGSDFTASLLCNFLEGEKVFVWKDVPGIMNADPVWYKNAVKIPEMHYKEAFELAFYGAKVIHPKTIKPLQDKHIPMEVKSFMNPVEKGTDITSDEVFIKQPLFILKANQILISIARHDLSFILEQSLSKIYRVFHEHKTSINMMQNSAASFTVCCDYDPIRIPSVINELSKAFKVLYNDNVALLTIRHYKSDSHASIIGKSKILVEQKSRSTVQFVFKPETNHG